MSHEYLRSAYSATHEVPGTSQSVVVISLQEDCLATNHALGITKDTCRVSRTSSSKTEITKMIHRIMLPDYPIPIPYQPPVHFSNICERWIPVSIPNDVRMMQM